MRFVFHQDISCKDVDKCSTTLLAKLTTLLQIPESSKPLNTMFHISILHEKNNHKIFVFTYTTGVHESEVRGKHFFNKNPNAPINKFTGKEPTLTQLKSKLTYSD